MKIYVDNDWDHVVFLEAELGDEKYLNVGYNRDLLYKGIIEPGDVWISFRSSVYQIPLESFRIEGVCKDLLAESFMRELRKTMAGMI